MSMGAQNSKVRSRRKTARSKRGHWGVTLLVLILAAGAGWTWLQSHPQHNPWAPLDLRHQIGWATATKLASLKDDVPQCREVLERSEVPFIAMESSGEGPCQLSDRTQLTDYPLSPETPTMTCPVAAALELWRTKTVIPAARDIFGAEVVRIEHLGTYSCRRLYGRDDGPWSEHATANAIDISAFVLADGRRISLIDDWDGDEDERRFLRIVRDGACGVFATVLSPDYNTAHADHFHFDQQSRWTGVCR